MQSDIEIAQAAKIQKIKEIAEKIDIKEEELELFGNYKAKLSDKLWERVKDRPNGKLVLVTAINPTPAGEGKSTTMVGLGQAMWKIGKRAIVAIREPSMGPVFGIKGGAAGGGYAQVIPMEDINLHFTGDMHAISAANNLLSAMIDNHIQQGNELGIDPRQVTWKRCVDLNDRSLRNIVIGLGGKAHGLPREDGFNISVASEIMAILCLANDLEDLKERLANIIIGYSFSSEAIRARDLNAQGSMTVILKDAIKPNLVQTLENTPAIMHGGPFANIAHGCNSVRATRLALKLSDLVLTEAGFGADLGAEKFLNIKCRMSGLKPDAIVLVATTRALAYNGKGEKDEVRIDEIKRGAVNLKRHIENLQQFGVPVVVTLNAFSDDKSEEIDFIRSFCENNGADFACSWVWERGGEGGKALAEKIVDVLETNKAQFELLYNDEMPIDKKIITIAQKIYRASSVTFSAKALKNIEQIKALDMESIPVCIAKTQYSFSDDPKKLGAPEDFSINIREIRLSAGAGFAVALAGDIMTMPGLPKRAAAEDIDINNGVVSGLF